MSYRVRFAVVIFLGLGAASKADGSSWSPCTAAQPLCVNAAKFIQVGPTELDQLWITGREPLSKEYEVVVFHQSQHDTFSLLVVHIATEQPMFLIDHLPSHRTRDYAYRISGTTHDSLTVEGYGATYGDSPVRIKYFFDPLKRTATKYEEIPASFSEIATHKGFVYFAGKQGNHGVIAKLRTNANKLEDATVITTVAGAPIEPILRVQSWGGTLRFVSENYVYDFTDDVRVLPNADKRRYKYHVADTASLGFKQLRTSVPQFKLEQYIATLPTLGGVATFLAWNEETAVNSYGGERRSGIYVSERGEVVFYPLPQPQISEPNPQFEVIYRNEIGPIQLVGEKIWFGVTFYDGEGYTGVGGIGTFDTKTRSYQLVYIPALADLSVSALLVDGDEVWLGLHGRTAGGMSGASVAKYQRDTGTLKRFNIAAVANKIVKLANGVYVATSDGIAVLSAENEFRSGRLQRARDGRYRFRSETQ